MEGLIETMLQSRKAETRGLAWKPENQIEVECVTEYSREFSFQVPHVYVDGRQMQNITTRVRYWTPFVACHITECDRYLVYHD